MSDQEELPEDIDNFRATISEMSFESLQKLKQKIGSKAYNAKVLGVKPKITKEKDSLKRENKNRPREMSSKIKVKPDFRSSSRNDAARDPRFDPLCGEFNEESFEKDYTFVNKIKRKEFIKLKRQLIKCKDPKEKRNIEYLLQRMSNQFREKKNKKEKKAHEKKALEKKVHEKKAHGKEESIKAPKDAPRKPQYKKKGEETIFNLMKKYERLKETNALNKHIERKSRKLASKEKRKNIV